MNTKKTIYLMLSILGLIVPYIFFGQFIVQNGLNLSLLIKDALVNDASSFFTYDVIISAIVLFVFMYFENRKQKVKYTWIGVLAACTVGVSCGLPLFLFFRELNKK